MKSVIVRTTQIGPAGEHIEYPLGFFTALFAAECAHSEICGTPSPVKLHGLHDFLEQHGTLEDGYAFFHSHDQLPVSKSDLYPPDADDTAIFLEAALVTGTIGLDAFHNGMRIVKNNRVPGENGFYVWLANKSGKRKSDIKDPVVDLNVWAALAHDPREKKEAQKRLFDLLANIPGLFCSPYYSNQDFIAWLALRAARRLDWKEQQAVLRSNRACLMTKCGLSVQNYEYVIGAERGLDILMGLVKKRFEHRPLFRHISHQTDYIYPGPYIDMNASLWKKFEPKALDLLAFRPGT